jgi:hypothetical protein
LEPSLDPPEIPLVPFKKKTEFLEIRTLELPVSTTITGEPVDQEKNKKNFRGTN